MPWLQGPERIQEITQAELDIESCLCVVRGVFACALRAGVPALRVSAWPPAQEGPGRVSQRSIAVLFGSRSAVSMALSSASERAASGWASRNVSTKRSMLVLLTACCTGSRHSGQV